MVLEPKEKDTIKESVVDRLRSNLKKITNFTTNSFNNIFLDAFADALYEYQIRLLAAQLSGWVDYAGGPITQNDLDRLGIGDFDDLSQLNEYMQDDQLDNLGKIVGISRDQGSPATGTVEIQTFDSQTPVPDGLQVSTESNADIESKVFTVDLEDDSVTPADQGNTDFVSVDVISTGNGDQYNVGTDTITRFESPPPGIESVTNPVATTGGEDEEGNEELRSRIKNAVFETSGGGTTEGIRGFILGNVDGVSDVFIDEFYDATPVYVDVIVDGGVTSDVEDAIEQSRPAGIRHDLIRPVTYNIGIDVELKGTDIDTAKVQSELEEYVFDLDLGEDFIEDKAKQEILNIEPNIDNILTFDVRIIGARNYIDEYTAGTDIYQLPEFPLGKIDNEEHYYTSTKDVYELGVHPVDGSTVTVEERSATGWSTISSSEYSVIDDDGDGMLESIDWTTGTVTPDDGSIFRVNYDTLTSTSETFTYNGSDTYSLTYRPALADDSSVSDNSGDTYTLGTDYDIIDDDGDGEKDTLKWLSGGSTPDNPEDFTVNYEVNVGSIYEVTGVSNDNDVEFTEGVDFNEADTDGDGYVDSIDWGVGGDSPDNGTDFQVDFTVQTDILEDYVTENREKISVVVDEVEVDVYG